jgi:DNA segregation ATPase FtsK/SpoIIIE-like protein
MSLALKYSYEELEFYLVDFKKGVEFKDYADYKLPHARVIAIEADREFGLSVLQALDKELARRGDLFKAKDVANLQQFREKDNEKLPRIILMVDEFQTLFSEDDSLAAEASNILDRIVRLGRSFGLKVIMASQNLSSSHISRSTKDQMAVRIALQSSEADSRLILGDENPAARSLTRPGEAIYNAANGSPEGDTHFQVFLLRELLRKELLEKLRKKAQHSGLPRPKEPIIFEGYKPAEFKKNVEFVKALESQYNRENVQSTKAWLGEPVAIKPHTFISFRRQSRSNLLITGQDEKTSVAMVITSILSVMSQQSSSQASFTIINLAKANSEWHNWTQHFTKRMPHTINVANRSDCKHWIQESADQVRHRSESDEAIEESYYLVIFGLHRARDLKKTDELELPSSQSQDLAPVLREGPDLGVHTIIWCDTVSSFTRVLERRMLSEFDSRVGLQMNQDDSFSLFDTVSANQLGPHHALLSDVERADTGNFEKFRPYSIPEPEFINEVAEKLQKKADPKMTT